MTISKHINFPTLLTLIRLIVSPLILPLLFVYLLPYNYGWLNATLAVLFVLISLTDFFDGYLARRYNQETTLGRVLDPIADKFLVYSTLIALLAIDKVYFYWVILLIGRELFVMGMRHVAVEHNFSVHVSLMGKTKTFVQLAYLTVAIYNPYKYGVDGMWLTAVQTILLLATLGLSLGSAYHYYSYFIVLFEQKNRTQDEVEVR